MDLTIYRQQVAKGLSIVETSIAHLVDALAHSRALIELEPTAAGDNPVRRVCDAYSAIDYRMDDEVGASVVCLGIVGVSVDMLRRAEAVNAAKAAFKAICAPLQDIRTRIPVK